MAVKAIKQLEQKVLDQTLDFNDPNDRFKVGAMTLIQEAFVGRLYRKGEVKTKPYYKLLNLRFKLPEEKDEDIKFPESTVTPKEIDTTFLMKKKLFELLDSLKK